MHHSRFIAVFTAILLGASTSGAADLTEVNRTITKEPAYQTKPTFCLLVFGPKAKDKVWLVLDGDTLYVDRNGNGDLTEDGESIKAPAFGRRNELGHRERSIDVGDISVAGLTHMDLVVRQVEHPRSRVVNTVTINLDPKCYGIFTDTKGQRVKHRAGPLVFTERPQEALVVHFGGPLTLHVGPDEKFYRGKDSGEVSFWLGTPGLGLGTFAVMDHDLIPKGVRPVVEIQFPAKENAQQPVGWKYALQAC